LSGSQSKAPGFANAAAEGFFSALKNNLTRHHLHDSEGARDAIFDFIEVFDN